MPCPGPALLFAFSSARLNHPELVQRFEGSPALMVSTQPGVNSVNAQSCSSIITLPRLWFLAAPAKLQAPHSPAGEGLLPSWLTPGMCFTGASAQHRRRAGSSILEHSWTQGREGEGSADGENTHRVIPGSCCSWQGGFAAQGSSPKSYSGSRSPFAPHLPDNGDRELDHNSHAIPRAPPALTLQEKPTGSRAGLSQLHLSWISLPPSPEADDAFAQVPQKPTALLQNQP